MLLNLLSVSSYLWSWTTKFKKFEIEIYTSSESWIQKLSIDVWIDVWSEIQLFENLESESAKKSKYWENRL